MSVRQPTDPIGSAAAEPHRFHREFQRRMDGTGRQHKTADDYVLVPAIGGKLPRVEREPAVAVSQVFDVGKARHVNIGHANRFGKHFDAEHSSSPKPIVPFGAEEHRMFHSATVGEGVHKFHSRDGFQNVNHPHYRAGDGMSKQAHTPGPFASLHFEPHNGYGAVIDGESMPFGYISQQGYGRPIFELSPIFEHDKDELTALALKMTAAPEMFEALAGFVSKFEEMNPMRSADYHANCDCLRCKFDAAKAALSKATGGE